MSIVAGVDFGTLSVRVSLFDSERGRLGAGSAEFPLRRKKDDPDYATQSHEHQMTALTEAMAQALTAADVTGNAVEALAIDATGSSVIPVDERWQPLNDYYLWCDHRSWREAAEITSKARQMGVAAIDWCGGTYSSEWGFSKVLHWLRHCPEARGRMATAMENCDLIAATLCGISDLDALPRSVCAMGHKWMWNEQLGGLPSQEFFSQVDPLFDGIRAKIGGRYATSDKLAGHLSEAWAGRLGLRAGIPIPVGALDAHWDAIGSGCRLGDVVNVIGTSTCIMAISDDVRLIPGLCGVVPGSIHPLKTGIEAGLSAVGDIFDAIARRANTGVGELSQGLEGYRAGQTGLLRLVWDNGDRTVLVNPELSGVTFGWRLTTTAQDELFAAIEGTALHTRIILQRMQEYGTPIERVINGGGIPRRSEVLNRVYANVLNKPVLVPDGDVTSLGSAIFAFLAAGTFASIEEAQAALCPAYRMVEPEVREMAIYAELSELFESAYESLGGERPRPLGKMLPRLRAIAEKQR